MTPYGNKFLGIFSIKAGKQHRALLGYLDPIRTRSHPDVIPFGALLPPTRCRNIFSTPKEPPGAVSAKSEP